MAFNKKMIALCLRVAFIVQISSHSTPTWKGQTWHPEMWKQDTKVSETHPTSYNGLYYSVNGINKVNYFMARSRRVGSFWQSDRNEEWINGVWNPDRTWIHLNAEVLNGRVWNERWYAAQRRLFKGDERSGSIHFRPTHPPLEGGFGLEILLTRFLVHEAKGQVKRMLVKKDKWTNSEAQEWECISQRSVN